MTKRRESREQAFTLLFEKTVTGDSMEDIIEMAKEARDVVIDPYCEKLTALTELYLYQFVLLLKIFDFSTALYYFLEYLQYYLTHLFDLYDCL